MRSFSIQHKEVKQNDRFQSDDKIYYHAKVQNREKRE